MKPLWNKVKRYRICYKACYKQVLERSVKCVQRIRGIWCVRMVVPSDLVKIMGTTELRHNHLPSDVKTRERVAVGIINSFFAQMDEAREILNAQTFAPRPTLSAAAKAHYRDALDADDRKRAAMPKAAEMEAECEQILRRLERAKGSVRQAGVISRMA